MAKCTKCQIEQPVENFYKDRGKYRKDCKICNRAAANARYDSEQRKAYGIANRTRDAATKRRRYAENPTYQLEINKRYLGRHREDRRAYMRGYARLYGPRLMNRIPKWADLKAIKEFYKNCPDGCEVDHIIPVRGKSVSGLHVLENLQYLTVEENRRKGNKFEV